MTEKRDKQKQKKGEKSSFSKGPTQGYPVLEKTFPSVLNLIKDLIWLFMLAVVFYWKAIAELFSPKKQKDVDEKIIVITGAASGIGRQLAIQFARFGSRVACVDINTEGNESTLKAITAATGMRHRAKSFTCDLADPDAVRKLSDDIYNEYGNIDILIHGAALIVGHDFLKADDKIVRRILDVNFVSSFWVLRSFINHMKKRGEGHVVVINSVTSHHPISYGTTYAASKAGLLGLIDSLDMELREDPATRNIKITSVHPYFVRTIDHFQKYVRVRFHLGLETSEAAQQIIVGIRREYRHFTVPGIQLGYLISSISRCLTPVRLYQMIRNVHGKLIVPEGAPYFPMGSDLNVPDKILKSSPSI